jgi:hypothetical protein
MFQEPIFDDWLTLRQYARATNTDFRTIRKLWQDRLLVVEAVDYQGNPLFRRNNPENERIIRALRRPRKIDYK